jgi:hypothetical protein
VETVVTKELSEYIININEGESSSNMKKNEPLKMDILDYRQSLVNSGRSKTVMSQRKKL